MNENDRGLTLEVKRDELKVLMHKRAEGHEHRGKVQAQRLVHLSKLMSQTATAGTDRIHGFVGAASGEEDDGTPIQVLDLSNSSMRDINQHVTYARDRVRAHETAATWLRFAAEHLARDSYVFEPTDNFLAYLVDVDHPTAMPNGQLYARGVQ